jgi:hypothetical protein
VYQCSRKAHFNRLPHLFQNHPVLERLKPVPDIAF